MNEPPNSPPKIDINDKHCFSGEKQCFSGEKQCLSSNGKSEKHCHVTNSVSLQSLDCQGFTRETREWQRIHTARSTR